MRFLLETTAQEAGPASLPVWHTLYRKREVKAGLTPRHLA